MFVSVRGPITGCATQSSFLVTLLSISVFALVFSYVTYHAGFFHNMIFAVPYVLIFRSVPQQNTVAYALYSAATRSDLSAQGSGLL
jgi:hypothetical protein